MTSASELFNFLEELHQDVLIRASIEGEEKLLPTAFTERVLEDLVSLGDIDDAVASHLRGEGYEVSGYDLIEAEGQLDLFVTRYIGSQQPERIPPSEIDAAIKGAIVFFERARNRLLRGVDPASPAFDMVLRIGEAERIDRMRIFVLTDALTRDTNRPSEEQRGALVSYHIWDLERLLKLARSGVHPEPLNIDIRALGSYEVPCIEAPASGGDYRAYLAIFPGQLLADLYLLYGPRLLELNVRSYLQARGKINAGIRRTILEEPEHFLAYNNGISVTAAAVTLESGPNGTSLLKAIDDIQIVNGGQTTASIATAKRKDNADLSNLWVAAKLTVVPSHLIDEFVPFISRYANSQNKVNEADFAANDPFHVSVEKMSRSVWAPAPEGTQRMTKWFYERARGQYADALARQDTLPRKNQFKLEYPPAQKFTKTDLAKFENSWEQYPHLVSRGAEKNFREFAITRGRSRAPIDEADFQDIVARAILFRSTEKIVSGLGLAGYRANVVAYSVAYLAHQTESRVDLEAIWRAQSLSEPIVRALKAIAPTVYAAITQPPGGGNVGEWCKQEKCWERVRRLGLHLPDITRVLIPVDRPPRAGSGTGHMSAEDAALIDRIKAVDGVVWLGISHWARETNHLASWQRSMAFSLGRLAQQHRAPSVKQAAQGSLILDEVERLGFRFQRLNTSDPESGSEG
jgi:AIPR protein